MKTFLKTLGIVTIVIGIVLVVGPNIFDVSAALGTLCIKTGIIDIIVGIIVVKMVS